MGDRILWIGDLQSGHDCELYITTEDGVEHDIYHELEKLNFLGTCLGDKIKVKIVIEKLL